MTMEADVERVAKDRADWLLDAVATATQDRRFLRGDLEYDAVAGEAILLNGRKAIRVAIAALPAEPSDGGWRGIETAPKEEWLHTVLLARDHGKRSVMPAVYDGENWRALSIAGLGLVYQNPTHWMPLPAPPSEANPS